MGLPLEGYRHEGDYRNGSGRGHVHCIVALEAGKLDQGTSGTKVLKDMMDAVCARTTDPTTVRSKLKRYGLQISDQKFNFYDFSMSVDGSSRWSVILPSVG